MDLGYENLAIARQQICNYKQSTAPIIPREARSYRLVSLPAFSTHVGYTVKFNN